MKALDLTVVLAATSAGVPLTRTLLSILGQTSPGVDVVLVGGAAEENWESEVPQQARQLITPLPMRFETVGEAFASGVAASKGRRLAFAEMGDVLHPRRFEIQLAGMPEAGGVCFQISSPGPHRPRSWVQQESSLPEVTGSLLAGRLDVRSLLVDREALTAVGGMAPDAAGAEVLFDLALRLALVGRLTSLDHPALAPQEEQMPEGADALLARRLAGFTGFTSHTISAAALLALRNATSEGQWPQARASLVPMVSAFSEQRRIGLTRLDPSGCMDSIAALQALLATDAEFLMVVEGEPPPRALLDAQLLRLETGDLDACLPVVDDGLFQEPSPRSLVPGTLFRRAAVERALALLQGSGEGRESLLWQLLAPIDAVATALPQRHRTIELPADLTGGDAVPLTAEQPPMVGRPLAPTGEPVGEAEPIRRLVHAEWYLEIYPDVAAAGVDPVEHYLHWGWAEGRDPNPWFSTNWYRKQHGIHGQGPAPELRHFVENCGQAGIAPHPDVDLAYYAKRYLGEEQPSARALVRLVETWRTEDPILSPRGNRRRWSREERELLDRLVDRSWYLKTYPDIAAAGVSPVEHYLQWGCTEDRDPNPWFSTSWYRQQHQIERATGAPELGHFIRLGAAQGHPPHPDVDLAYYAKRYLGEEQPSAHALVHLVETWRTEDPILSPRGNRRRWSREERELLDRLVDSSWYLETYPDIAAAGINPVEHYLQWGCTEDRDPNPWFSTSWYRQQHQIERAADAPELGHFIRLGAPQGHPPHPDVDLAYYAKRYLGEEQPSARALAHLVETWRTEDPILSPRGNSRPLNAAETTLLHRLVDRAWYLEAYPDVAESGIDPTRHYLEHGWTDGRDPNPWFSTRWYARQVSLEGSGPAPELRHFVRVGASRGAAPHPDVDLAWYARRHLGEQRPSPQALLHLVESWRAGVMIPSPLIDNPLVSAFLASQPRTEREAHVARLRRLAAADCRSAVVAGETTLGSDFVHLVDNDWYYATCPEAAEAGAAPARHYRESGWTIGKDPNPAFYTAWYMSTYPDAAASGLCPLDFYLTVGASRGDRPSPLFDPVWYARRYGVPGQEPQAPLLDFVATWRSTSIPRLSHPLFSHAAVLTRLLEIRPEKRADELRWLWHAREAFEAEPQQVEADAAERWTTILLWTIPERSKVVVLTRGAEFDLPANSAPRVYLSWEGNRIAVALDPSFERCTLWFNAERDRVSIASLLAEFDVEPDLIFTDWQNSAPRMLAS